MPPILKEVRGLREIFFWSLREIIVHRATSVGVGVGGVTAGASDPPIPIK